MKIVEETKQRLGMLCADPINEAGIALSRQAARGYGGEMPFFGRAAVFFLLTGGFHQKMQDETGIFTKKCMQKENTCILPIYQRTGKIFSR